MMIKEWKHLIKLQHIRKEQMHLKYVKVRYLCLRNTKILCLLKQTGFLRLFLRSVLISFRKGEMFSVMKYKDFLLDNKNDIEKTDAVSKANNAKCIVNRSIKFCEK